MSASPWRPPELVRVRQRFPVRPPVDVVASLERLLHAKGIAAAITPGARVALTAGSRGVRDVVPVLRTLAGFVRAAGGVPFVVPCMGSHGGATAAGQEEVLASLGVNQETVGAPVVSSMDAVPVGESRFGAPVWVARDLTEADFVIAVNRVKPHTDFFGPFESGLIKMLVIGAGKHRGALEAHRLAIRHGFPAVLEEYARVVLARVPVLCGVALLEDESDRTAEIHVLHPGEIISGEPPLLARAARLAPSLPFDAFDCLLVDEIGKEISGNGMDAKVVGRIDLRSAASPDRPRITRIVVRDLTEASHGNAIGIGSADFTTTRLLARIDQEAMKVNCLTSAAPESGRLPLAFERDVDAVRAAFDTCGAASVDEFTLVWIRNTLQLQELLISTALLPLARADARLEVVSAPTPFPVEADGSLTSAWGWDGSREVHNET